MARVSTQAWLGLFAKFCSPSPKRGGDVAQQNNQQYRVPTSLPLAGN